MDEGSSTGRGSFETYFLMDHILFKDRDFADDIESCRIAIEDGSYSSIPSDKLDNLFPGKVSSGLVSLDLSVKGGTGENSCTNPREVCLENVQVLIETGNKVGGVVAADLLDKLTEKDKRKSLSANKPPKPPRPPRGLSLDAADQKLMKEFAELAVIKRARIERMKELKKMKSSKAPPSSSSSFNGILFAMLCTVLFCVVVICQGMSSGNNAALSLKRSMVTAGATASSFAVVEDRTNVSADERNSTHSLSPERFAEHVSGLDAENLGNTATG